MNRKYHDIGELALPRSGAETYISTSISPSLTLKLQLQHAEQDMPRRLFVADDLTAEEARQIGQLLLRGADFIEAQQTLQNQRVLPFTRRAA